MAVAVSFASQHLLSHLLLPLNQRHRSCLWSHVTGSMKKGELPWQGIVREFYEESLVEVTDLYNG
ncbi:NUDIX domain-containing protein [Pseudoalteromonas maricaloris]|uniref:NUDIX domain-containing protein n=1 Tax=Pseudoalteromonas maricaloris TaxID=184924 RepID=UPI0021AD6FF4|nr:NUDIX domain-containing protein [Pseudoalteromonas flavipulchra]